MREEQIARRTRWHPYVTHLDKSGKPSAPIKYWAAPGERPVFDLSAVKPEGLRISAFFVPGSRIPLRGLEVIGAQVTAKGPHAVDLLRQ